MEPEKLEEKLVSKYSDRISVYPDESSSEEYEGILSEVEENFDKISPAELEGYILDTAGKYNKGSRDEVKAKIHGMFSGALLEKAYDTSDSITLDGHGAVFDHLFSHGSEIGDLFLKNIKGDRILERAGSEDGTAGNIYLVNIRGDWLLNNGFREGGEVDTVLMKSVYGKKNGTFLGYDAKSMENVILSGIYGDHTGGWLGKNCDDFGTLVTENLYGDNSLEYSGTPRKRYDEEDIPESSRNVLLLERTLEPRVEEYCSEILEQVKSRDY